MFSYILYFIFSLNEDSRISDDEKHLLKFMDEQISIKKKKRFQHRSSSDKQRRRRRTQPQGKIFSIVYQYKSVCRRQNEISFFLTLEYIYLHIEKTKLNNYRIRTHKKLSFVLHFIFFSSLPLRRICL